MYLCWWDWKCPTAAFWKIIKMVPQPYLLIAEQKINYWPTKTLGLSVLCSQRNKRIPLLPLRKITKKIPPKRQQSGILHPFRQKLRTQLITTPDCVCNCGNGDLIVLVVWYQLRHWNLLNPHLCRRFQTQTQLLSPNKKTYHEGLYERIYVTLRGK